MKILVIDNYDSFTYNLVHMIKELENEDVDVFRNDKISVADVGKYDKIILSPGPGIPSESGIVPEVIKTYAPNKSILGICLGEQAIGEAFGASLVNLSDVYHGVSSKVSRIADDVLFDGIGEEFEVGRYHSWAVSGDDFPAELVVTAVDDNGMIMALAHKKYDVRGVQFHPESVLTPDGKKMLANWLKN